MIKINFPRTALTSTYLEDSGAPQKMMWWVKVLSLSLLHPPRTWLSFRDPPGAVNFTRDISLQMEIRMMQKKATKNRVVKTKAKATPEEIAWGMPIGVAMDAYVRHATKRDQVESKRIYDGIIDLIEGLRASGITGKQATMAALNFAYVILLVQAEYAETGGKMNVLRFPLPTPSK